jgi:hypothetical protein
MSRLKLIVKRSVIEIAKARRTCKFSSEAIAKGTICLVVHDGPRDRACYSQRIGLEMIELARARLDELEKQLSATAAS